MGFFGIGVMGYLKEPHWEDETPVFPESSTDWTWFSGGSWDVTLALRHEVGMH